MKNSYQNRASITLLRKMLFRFFHCLSQYFSDEVSSLKLIPGEKSLEVHFLSGQLNEKLDVDKFINSSFINTLKPKEVISIFSSQKKYESIHPKYRISPNESIDSIFYLRKRGSSLVDEIYLPEIIQDKEIISNLCKEDLELLSKSITMNNKKDSYVKLRLI